MPADCCFPFIKRGKVLGVDILDLHRDQKFVVEAMAPRRESVTPSLDFFFSFFSATLYVRLWFKYWSNRGPERILPVNRHCRSDTATFFFKDVRFSVHQNLRVEGDRVGIVCMADSAIAEVRDLYASSMHSRAASRNTFSCERLHCLPPIKLKSSVPKTANKKTSTSF